MSASIEDLLGFPTVSGRPSIEYNESELAAVDDPEHIRWRAEWLYGGDDQVPVGIMLYAHPVVRKTPAAAWIDKFAFRVTCAPQPDGSTRRWALTGDHKLVYDGSSAAWAKPTREEALQSLGVRLLRWRSHVARDVERINAALDVAGELLESPVAGATEDRRFVFSTNRLPAKGLKL